MKNVLRLRDLDRRTWRYLFISAAGEGILNHLAWAYRGSPKEEIRSPVGSSPIDPVSTSPFGSGDVARIYYLDPRLPMEKDDRIPIFFKDEVYRVAGRLRDGRFFYICCPVDAPETFVPEYMRDLEIHALAVVTSSLDILMPAIPVRLRDAVVAGMRKAEKPAKRRQLEGRS